MSDEIQRYRSNGDDIVAKVIDGEAIIINLGTGVYYSTDGIGARIWELVTAGGATGEIVDRLCTEYEVAPDRCHADVTAIVSKCLDECLIIVDGDRPTPAEVAAMGNGERAAYTEPQLHVYRDMGDLLALDPPVPGLAPIPWSDPTRPAAPPSD